MAETVQGQCESQYESQFGSVMVLLMPRPSPHSGRLTLAQHLSAGLVILNSLSP